MAAAILGGLKALGAGKVVGKLAGKAGAWLGKRAGVAGKVAGAVGVGAAATVAGETVYNRMTGGDGLFGMPLTTDAMAVEVVKAPPGYVLVRNPDNPDEQIAVLKEVAYALGLRKRPRRGGGLTASQIRAARHVNKVISSLTVARQPRFKLKKGRRR